MAKITLDLPENSEGLLLDHDYIVESFCKEFLYQSFVWDEQLEKDVPNQESKQDFFERKLSEYILKIAAKYKISETIGFQAEDLKKRIMDIKLNAFRNK